MIIFIRAYLGTETIERPVYRNENLSDDEEFVTLFWEHDSRDTVSHYILTLVEAKDGGQVLQYNVTSTSITIPSTSIDMNGMLSAVSVCGDESEPVSFQGNNNNQTHYLDSMTPCRHYRIAQIFRGVIIS